MAVFYRKYRPQTFAEVVGQQAIVQTLKNQVANNQLAHAYVFTGSRGVGKTSVARILAKAVNCEKVKNGEPCGKCPTCKQIEQGSFLDLVEIDAASNTGVDNIRDLIEHVKFSPSSGTYKVFIIDEVHMLSKGAFNALLKTLEEPPRHALFILATTEIGKVPATIISRTQRFDFKRLSTQDLVKHLAYVLKQEKLSLAPEIVELIAQHAEGGGRDALSLLEKVMSLGSAVSVPDAQALLGVTDMASCERLLELIQEGQSQDLPEFILGLSERGADLPLFTKDFLEYLRKALVLKMSPQAELVMGDSTHRPRLEELVGRFTVQDLIFIIRLFLRAYKDMADSPSADIPLLLAAAEAAMRFNPHGTGSGPVAPLTGTVHAQVAKVKTQESPPLAPSVRQEPQKPVSETVPTAALDEMSLPELRLLWPSVIEQVRTVNGPLANLIKNSPLQSVENGRVILSVKYVFHKQNLENPKNLQLVTEILQKVSGKHLAIAARVVKEEAVDSRPTPESLGEALKIFGGEVIE